MADALLSIINGSAGPSVSTSAGDPLLSIVRPQGEQSFQIGSPLEDMSTTDKLRAGIGMGMSKVTRAVGQAFGLVDQKDIDESNRLDAALANTTAGNAGDVVGRAAATLPAILIPGANTYYGAAGVGALVGGLTTEGDLKNRTVGGALGAVGGVAAKGLGDAIGYGLDSLAARRAQAAVENAGRDAAAVSARSAGYTLPPVDTNPSVTTEVLNGLSGKIKTAQTASARNQFVTNDLARQEIGAPLNQPLDASTLNGVRNAAGQAYNAVRSGGTITPGPQYEQALDRIAAPFKQAAAGFPNAAPSPVISEIDALRSPQFDASSAISMIQKLRADADSAFAAGDKLRGKALRDGAGALENAIEDHLTALTGNQPGAQAMLDAFRNARQLIAKTYSLQKATNLTTGDVSAQMLARQLDKGAPLSGNLLLIANTAKSFPRAMQTLREAPNQFSPLDFGAALVTGIHSGNPAAAAIPLLRPAVRYGLLSSPVQGLLGQPSYSAPIQGLLGSALDSQLLQRFAPAGAGLMAASYASQ